MSAPVGTPALGSAPVGTHVGTGEHVSTYVPVGGFTEWLRTTDTRPVFVVTNAPAAYDYAFTVRTDAEVKRYRATCTVVTVPEDRLRVLIDRYLSGSYVAEVW